MRGGLKTDFLLYFCMSHHYIPDRTKSAHYGEIYRVDAPLYDACTLFKEDNIGLCVIQQRHAAKMTFWSWVDPWLNDDLYLNENFYPLFKKLAAEPKDGIYPTITLRTLMRQLKMRPLKREFWETYFA